MQEVTEYMDTRMIVFPFPTPYNFFYSVCSLDLVVSAHVAYKTQRCIVWFVWNNIIVYLIE